MTKDRSAAELADMLEGIARHPHNTGGLSLLDDATLAFGNKDVAIDSAQRAFATARYRHMRSYSSAAEGYSEQAWEEAMAAARGLAVLLRPLGDTRIARCQRKAGWGTCNLPLSDDGACWSSLGHTDEND